MNKIFFGIGAVILLYGCFYYNKISNKKKDNINLDQIKNINLNEIKNINLNEEKVIILDKEVEINLDKEVEDIVDNLITNVVALSQKQEKKIKFDDNWVEIESTIEDHNKDTF
tara:strand:+ start:83 stop:421 length:339 start_codon:yes stop_codon:yes gene_type:complete